MSTRSFFYIWLIMALAQSLASPAMVLLEPFTETELNSNTRLVTGETTGSMRGLLSSPDRHTQRNAASALLNSGDVPSIARLVYAVRQGSVDAAILLYDFPSLETLRYLVEDIEHGNLGALPGNTSGDDVMHGFPTVKEAAIRIALRCIASASELPEVSRAWAKELANRYAVFAVVDHAPQSDLLLWWSHNELALRERRFRDAGWTPLIRPWKEPTTPRKSPPEPPPPPPPFQKVPIQLPESFSSWSTRIANSGALLVVPPPLRTDRQEVGFIGRTSSDASSASSVSTPEQSDSTPWAIVVVMIAAAIGLLWLVLKRRGK